MRTFSGSGPGESRCIGLEVNWRCLTCARLPMSEEREEHAYNRGLYAVELHLWRWTLVLWEWSR